MLFPVSASFLAENRIHFSARCAQERSGRQCQRGGLLAHRA
jgi:hypothetical protein